MEARRGSRSKDHEREAEYLSTHFNTSNLMIWIISICSQTNNDPILLFAANSAATALLCTGLSKSNRFKLNVNWHSGAGLETTA